MDIPNLKNRGAYLSLQPIMVEEIFKESEVFTKENTDIHEMNIRSELENVTSPMIKIRFRLLDNPKPVLNILK